MERLTRRTANGDLYTGSLLKYYNYQDWQTALHRLAHYEDLEEQGRLVVLPVTVGTKVYIPDANNEKVLEKEVKQLSFTVHGKWIITLGSISAEFEDIGSRLFLTKEEAETAMKGMNWWDDRT